MSLEKVLESGKIPRCLFGRNYPMYLPSKALLRFLYIANLQSVLLSYFYQNIRIEMYNPTGYNYKYSLEYLHLLRPGKAHLKTILKN